VNSGQFVAQTHISGPHLNYTQLMPMLIVFGVAILGVLVEAFAGRSVRYRLQVIISVAGLIAAFCAVLYIAGVRFTFTDGFHTVAGTYSVAAEGALAIDRAGLFIQGVLLLLGLVAILLVAERRLEAGGDAFAAQASAVPGSEAERVAISAGLAQTEVFPLTLFALGGMLVFAVSNDLLTMFVALEVLSLPLYLLCGMARRRRLLSQEAAMKYFLLGAFSSAFFLYGVAPATTRCCCSAVACSVWVCCSSWASFPSTPGSLTSTRERRPPSPDSWPRRRPWRPSGR
jgi:NADH-quinone oxidoreductase subunit N